MTDCPACEHYRNNAGDRACLACKQFKWILPRPYTPRGESTPFIEEIAMPDVQFNPLLFALREIPTRHAIVLFQMYWLNHTSREVADYHKISQARAWQIKREAELALRSALDKLRE